MGMWGGGAAGGWSTSATSMGPNARRGLDGWNDDDLGKIYDSAVVSRLGPYLRPYRARVILAMVGVIGFSLASTVQPLLIGMAVDDAVRGNLDGLWRMVLWLIATVIVSWGFQYLQLTQTGYIGHRILLSLRREMFGHIQKIGRAHV